MRKGTPERTMRRTSFVAPILLIAIGGLFLARNIYPEMPLLDWVSKYWPLILVGWGLLRIVEIVSWAASSKPLPARGISGGEWVLIVFLCLFGASLHAGATVQAEQVWNAEALDFDALPNLVIHRATFQFDGVVSLPLKLFEDGPSTDGPYCKLLKETLVGFE